MPGWTNLHELVRREFIQSQEEGKSPDALAALQAEFAALSSAPTDQPALIALQAKLVGLPVDPAFPFLEPNDLASIQSLRRDRRAFAPSPLDDTLADKLHGAWLGRAAGCALGKPPELIGLAPPACTRQNTWRDLKRYLTAISPDEWPIRDYIPAHSPAEKEVIRLICPRSTREKIAYMESDDDIRYTVLGQMILARHGAAFTTEHVADMWMHKLTYRSVCTAETQAFRNLIARYDFHEGNAWEFGPLPIDWHWVTTHLNPYREWIGAQIRVDSYAYAAPGQPELASDFAWRDVRLSHVKNGLYASMMCAAMIAAAFATDDVHAIVAAGLGEIPATCRLHDEMRAVIALCAKHGDRFENFESVFEELWALLGHYSTTHSNNNVGVIIVALLLSRGDYHRGITLAVMAGFDTDCNGATVGSILGAMHGARRLPTHWTGRLNDTLRSDLPEYHPIALSECARRSFEIVRQIRTSTHA